jgi:ribosomal protein S10
MKSLCVTISSNNQKSLKKLNLFNKKTKINKKLKMIEKLFTKKTEKSIFSVLTSPHVNKKAQEQFEYKIFANQHQFYSYNLIAFIIYLKKFLNYALSDARLTIKLINTINFVKSNLISQNLNIRYFKVNFQKFYEIQDFIYRRIKRKKLYIKTHVLNISDKQINTYIKSIYLYGKLI